MCEVWVRDYNQRTPGPGLLWWLVKLYWCHSQKLPYVCSHPHMLYALFSRTTTRLQWLDQRSHHCTNSTMQINPFSAMGDFSHHFIENVTHVRLKDLTYGLISWVKCSSERFTVAKNLFWLVNVGWMGCKGQAAHSANIHQYLDHKSSWHSGD